MAAFGRPFYRGGLISRRTVVRALASQLVYLHLGAERAAAGPDPRVGAGPDQGLGPDRGVATSSARPSTRSSSRSSTPRPSSSSSSTGRRGAGSTWSRPRPRRSCSPWPSTSAWTGPSPAGPWSTSTAATPGEMAFYAYGPFKAEAMPDAGRARGHRPGRRRTPTPTPPPTCPCSRPSGHPVAVNPDRVLARLARERGWEIAAVHPAGAAARPRPGAHTGAHDRGRRWRGAGRCRRGQLARRYAGRPVWRARARTARPAPRGDQASRQPAWRRRIRGRRGWRGPAASSRADPEPLRRPRTERRAGADQRSVRAGDRLRR